MSEFTGLEGLVAEFRSKFGAGLTEDDLIFLRRIVARGAALAAQAGLGVDVERDLNQLKSQVASTTAALAHEAQAWLGAALERLLVGGLNAVLDRLLPLRAQ